MYSRSDFYKKKYSEIIGRLVLDLNEEDNKELLNLLEKFADDKEDFRTPNYIPSDFLPSDFKLKDDPTPNRLEDIIPDYDYHQADIIFTDAKDVFKAIEENIKKGHRLRKFDDILPLLDNTDFIDSVLKNQFEFTSIENRNLAESYSDALKYVNEKFAEFKENSHDLGEVMTNSADLFAKKMGPQLDKLHTDGLTSLNAKAKHLNALGVKTMRGKDWTKTAIKNTHERWQKLKQNDNTNSMDFKL